MKTTKTHTALATPTSAPAAVRADQLLRQQRAPREASTAPALIRAIKHRVKPARQA